MSPLFQISLQLLTPSLHPEFSDSCLAQPCARPDPHCIRQKHLLSLAPCCAVSASQGALAQEENPRPGLPCTTLPCLSAVVISTEHCCPDPPSTHSLSSFLSPLLLLDLGANFPPELGSFTCLTINSLPSPAQPCACCSSSSCPALSSAAFLLEQSQARAPSGALLQGSSGDAGTNSRGDEQGNSSHSLHSAQLDQPPAFFQVLYSHME